MALAHKATSIFIQLILPNLDNGGSTALTIPQAIAIRSVFDPGISLNFRYLKVVIHCGTTLML